MMSSEGTALITGASSGFGLLASVALARRGWRVLATKRDLSRRTALEQAARAANVLDRIEIHALDVTSAEQIASLAATIADRPTPLHALVNNAGFAMAGFADDVSDAELRQQFDTNFFGAAAVTRAFLPQLRRQGFGHIAMVSSISGRTGFPGLSSYAGAKFALEGWAESLRLELLPLGIHVVIVEPGSFETGIWTRGAVMAQQALDVRSPNAKRSKQFFARTVQSQPKADPQIVADGIARIVENPRPRLRYVFGADARGALLLRGLLPWRAFERIVIKVSGIGG